MTTTKPTKPVSPTLKKKRSIAKEPKPSTLWKQININSVDRYISASYLPATKLPTTLAQKRSFYKVVGKNVYVLSELRSSYGQSSLDLMRRDHSEIGKERLSRIQEDTQISKIPYLLYGKNEYRRATEKEALLYHQYKRDLDAFIDKAREKERLSRLKKAKSAVTAIQAKLTSAQRLVEELSKKSNPLQNCK